MNGDAPAFPPFSGTEQLPRVLTTRIAAVAWEKAASEDEFRRLCLQHVRGDIDLFAEFPAETDATERVRAIQAQNEMERAVGMPQPPEPQPAEREPAIAGPAPADRSGQPIGSRPGPVREE